MWEAASAYPPSGDDNESINAERQIQRSDDGLRCGIRTVAAATRRESMASSYLYRLRSEGMKIRLLDCSTVRLFCGLIYW